MTTIKTQRALKENLSMVKKALPSEDVLVYEFQTADGVDCAIVYADGIVNKQLLGELVAIPLSHARLKDERDFLLSVQQTIRFPELKTAEKLDECVKEILDGNSSLFVDGIETAFIMGEFVPLTEIPGRRIDQWQKKHLK